VFDEYFFTLRALKLCGLVGCQHMLCQKNMLYRVSCS
jgi:hypothetical protein